MPLHSTMNLTFVNSTLANRTTENFEKLFGNTVNLTYLATVTVVIEVFGNFFLLALVWCWELNPMISLSQKLNCTSARLFVLHNATVLTFELFMAIVRPLSHDVCKAYTVWKSVLTCAIINSFMFNTAVQFLYATKWKNLNSINDFFLSRFFTALNLLMTTLFFVYTLAFKDYIHQSYIMCTGKAELLKHPTLDLMPIWRNILVVFHIAVVVRIILGKKELSDLVDRTQIFRRAERALGMKIPHPALDQVEESLFMTVVVIVLVVIHVATRPQRATAVSVSTYHRYFLQNTFFPVAISIFFPLVVFWRKKNYRVSLFREMKTCFEDFTLFH